MELISQGALENASQLEFTLDASKVKHQAIWRMNQVEGFCSESKACVLVDLVLKKKPEIIVEIGVWGGKSLIPMASALAANRKGMIYGIDPWSNAESLVGVSSEANKSYWTWADHEAVFLNLVQKLGEFGLFPWVTLIRATSENASPISDIDLLHIDGNHSDETSYLDVTKWGPLVKKGGFIVFDDIGWFENGVFTNARAVEWLDTHCEKVCEFKDSCTWGIWKK